MSYELSCSEVIATGTINSGTLMVSIGISKLKQSDTAEDFIMRADNALYQAKESGRNKTITEIVN